MTRISLNFSIEVYKALEQEAEIGGITVSQLCSDTITTHVASGPHLSASHKEWLKLNKELCTEVADYAVGYVEYGKFPENVTELAVAAAQSNPQWLSRYQSCIGSPDHLAKGNRLKADINQNIGFYVKRALKAQNVMTPNGTSKKGVAKGLIITQYTKLKPRT